MAETALKKSEAPCHGSEGQCVEYYPEKPGRVKFSLFPVLLGTARFGLFAVRRHLMVEATEQMGRLPSRVILSRRLKRVSF
jgi:hypothetical protein